MPLWRLATGEVVNDFARVCFERCSLDARGTGGRLDPFVHPSGMATVGGSVRV